MRILIIATTLDRPEAAIFAGLAKKGAQVHVIATPLPEHRATLEEAGIAVTHYDFRNRFDIRGMRLVRRLVIDNGYQVVYALSNRGLSSSVVGLLGIDVPVVAYRGTVGHISWFDPSSWFTYLNPKVRRIFCVSKAVEDYLLSIGISPEKATTIYKGHRLEWYHVKERPLRSELGIPDGAFVVGCTAVMRAVKGIDDLLGGVELLLKELPHLHLLLVGSIKDPDIERRVANFSEPDRLHLTGFRRDATALALLMDVTVMASKNREGFPKSVVEAMSQGIPAIVTAVGGMPELVGNGEAGVMVKPQNPESIADAIRVLYRDPELRARLGRAGQNRIATIFNVDQTIERTFDELLRLVQSIDSSRRSRTTASQTAPQR